MITFPPNPLKQAKREFRLTYDSPDCCACQEYYHLRTDWLEDDRPAGRRTAYLEVWRHVHSCPVCAAALAQARAFAEAAKAIQVELPAPIPVEELA